MHCGHVHSSTYGETSHPSSHSDTREISTTSSSTIPSSSSSLSSYSIPPSSVSSAAPSHRWTCQHHSRNSLTHASSHTAISSDPLRTLNTPQWSEKTQHGHSHPTQADKYIPSPSQLLSHSPLSPLENNYQRPAPMTLMLADSVKNAWGMQKINDTKNIFSICIAKAQQKHKSA